MIDYSDLATRLLRGYAVKCIEQAKEVSKKLPRNEIEQTIGRLGREMLKYVTDGDDVMEAVDLGTIFEKVEELESKTGNSDNKDNKPDGYDDRLVAAIAWYFKTTFFKWINVPDCEVCGPGQVRPVGREAPAPGFPNPDECTVIENYKCFKCMKPIQFRRLNNPSSLLRTRIGRCGEWVACFLYIARALMPAVQFRYIWCYEDHVWCEYYSDESQRWVHVDPCENVIDEPSLYSSNWRKKMSLVIGFGNDYCIDLLDKYIVSDRIPVLTETAASVKRGVKYVNSRIIVESGAEWQAVYDKFLRPYNLELLNSKVVQPTRSSTAVQGRQSGKGGWTAGRGEDGN